LGKAYTYLRMVKLIYFNAKGRAEVARLYFAEAGVEYEDYRFPTNADNDVNPSRPNDAYAAWEKTGKGVWGGQVPALELENGFTLCQTRAIERYIATRWLLMPKDDVEAALADGVIEACNDVQTDVVKVIFGSEESKAAAKKDLLENGIPHHGAKFSALLASYGSGYYGRQFSHADINAYVIWDLANMLTGGAPFGSFPAIKAHCELVASRPRIKAYLAVRK